MLTETLAAPQTETTDTCNPTPTSRVTVASPETFSATEPIQVNPGQTFIQTATLVAGTIIEQNSTLEVRNTQVEQKSFRPVLERVLYRIAGAAIETKNKITRSDLFLKVVSRLEVFRPDFNGKNALRSGLLTLGGALLLLQTLTAPASAFAQDAQIVTDPIAACSADDSIKFLAEPLIIAPEGNLIATLNAAYPGMGNYYQEVAELNCIVNPSIVQPDQEIYVPIPTLEKVQGQNQAGTEQTVVEQVSANDSTSEEVDDAGPKVSPSERIVTAIEKTKERVQEKTEDQTKTSKPGWLTRTIQNLEKAFFSEGSFPGSIVAGLALLLVIVGFVGVIKMLGNKLSDIIDKPQD